MEMTWFPKIPECNVSNKSPQWSYCDGYVVNEFYILDLVIFAYLNFREIQNSQIFHLGDVNELVLLYIHTTSNLISKTLQITDLYDQ